MSDRKPESAANEAADIEAPAGRSRRRRRLRRLVIAVAATAVAVVVVVAGSGFLLVYHAMSMVHRIPGIAALNSRDQPVMPAATRGSMTVLLTGSKLLPRDTSGSGTLGSSRAPESKSGLIALVHLNENMRGGAVVSIPPDAVVPVPGHGRIELWRALRIGGPSLLIKSVEHLTNVRVNHYSVLDFRGVERVIGALGGVNVAVPATFRSDGVSFHAGMDHLGAATALPYVRQSDVSEVGRTLLEQNLIRVMLIKLSHERFRPMTDVHVIDDLAAALSVDSNFTDRQLARVLLGLSRLQGEHSVFVTALTTNGSPTAGGDRPVLLKTRIDDQLWQSIRHDSVASFARRFPSAVTPTNPH